MKELINILLPPISVILSAIISYFISKTNAKNEIKKISMEFAKEERDKFNNNFAKLSCLTAEYLKNYNEYTANQAIEINAILLTIAPKEYLSLLQEMDTSLNSHNIVNVANTRKKLIQTFSTEK